MENSPLNRLSGEIRNMIYDLVLIEPKGIQLSIKKPNRKNAVPSARSKLKRKRTGLPLTCRIIRQETLRLYYHLNPITLHFVASRSGSIVLQAMQSWAGKIGREQAKEIRHVTLHVGRPTADLIDISWAPMIQIMKLFAANATLEATVREPGFDLRFVLSDYKEAMRRLREVEPTKAISRVATEMMLERIPWGLWN